MSDKNRKTTKEKVDSKSPSPSRSPAQRQRRINEGASSSTTYSPVQQSPRLFDRVSDAYGGARPKTSIYAGKEKSKKESKTEENPSPKKYKSAVSIADRFKASQTTLASSSCSSLDSYEDSDSQVAGNSSGKSAASNSPELQRKSTRKLKSVKFSLKKLLHLSPKKKDESEMNLIESEETTTDMEDAQETVKIKKKKTQKFDEYKAVAGNFSKATLGRTPSTGPESDPSCTDVDSELSSPEKDIDRLRIDKDSRSRDASKTLSVTEESLQNTAGSSRGRYETRATHLRDESKQNRKEASSPYSSPGKCDCIYKRHHDPDCRLKARMKLIRNRKKGLAPPRRKSKSPSPKRD